MSLKTKEYIKSSIITFITAFAIAVVPIINTLTLENVATGALASLIFTGIRAGVKALLEYFIAKYSQK